MRQVKWSLNPAEAEIRCLVRRIAQDPTPLRPFARAEVSSTGHKGHRDTSSYPCTVKLAPAAISEVEAYQDNSSLVVQKSKKAMLLYSRVAPPKIPKRRSRAGCTYCKYKKKKCSESRPKCERCEEHGQECVYEPIKPRQRRRRYCDDGMSPASMLLSSPLGDSAIHFPSKGSPHMLENRETFMWGISNLQLNGALAFDRSRRESATAWMRSLDDMMGDFACVRSPHDGGVGSSLIQAATPDLVSPLHGVGDEDVEEIPRDGLTISFTSSRSDLSFASSMSDSLATTTPNSMASPLLELPNPGFAEFPDEKNRRILLDHFANVLSHLIILHEDQGNPFQQLVLPLAHRNTTVMNAVCALSSAHLEYRGFESSEKSFLFHSQAIEGLSGLIKSGCDWNKNELLAAIMLLVYCEVLVQPCRPGVVQGHLKGAMAIMDNNPKMDNPTGVFLERAFRFYDVITALSYGTAPISQAPDNGDFILFPPIDCRGATVPAGNADTLLGMATSLWPIIHRLSTLSGLKEKLMEAELLGNDCGAALLRVEFESAASYIEVSLQQWQPVLRAGEMPPLDGRGLDPPHRPHSSPDDMVEATAKRPMSSMIHSALAYRHSGFVYLYRSIYGRAREDGEVQHHARKSLVHCLGTVKSGGPMGALLWPLFVAACEAMDSSDRRLANEAFMGIGQRQGMANIDRAWWIVQEVWRRADAEREGSNDAMVLGDFWRVVSAEMGLSVVFG